MELGERIDRLRETRGWTKKELAERLHLSPSMVSEWIRGVRDVTRENLEKLSDIFGVSVDYLLGRTDVPNPIAPAALSPHLPSGAFARGKTRSIPVLGTIRAGTPILAAENVIGQEEVDVKIVGDNEADKSYFFLRVAGDSMAGARILENDLVLIHEQPSVENGEIAYDDGSYLDPSTVSHIFSRLADRIGVDEATFHSQRHTYVTRLIETGADPFTVQELAGHASVTTTRVYVHTLDERKRQAVEKMSKPRKKTRAQQSRSKSPEKQETES